MTGVNDLANRWREEWEDDEGVTHYNVYECSECAEDLENVAHTTWKPVSDPPTEEDGDNNGMVLCWVAEDSEGPETVMVWPWRDVKPETGIPATLVLWARVRDVILLPPR